MTEKNRVMNMERQRGDSWVRETDRQTERRDWFRVRKRKRERKHEVAGEGEYLTAPCDLRSQDCYAILSRGHAPDKTHDLRPSAATMSPSKGKLCFSFRGTVVRRVTHTYRW